MFVHKQQLEHSLTEKRSEEPITPLFLRPERADYCREHCSDKKEIKLLQSFNLCYSIVEWNAGVWPDKYGWTETYDPKASSSCEVLWDKEAKYARMWIESQNPVRIVARFRTALADPDGYIAHSYIPSGSPYGKGDWTDEWYYIYPDGTDTLYNFNTIWIRERTISTGRRAAAHISNLAEEPN